MTPTATKKNVAVLISGRGSNMVALARACADGEFPARIALVVSDNADAAGLLRARKENITTHVLDPRGFSSRDHFDRALDGLLRAHDIEIICCAGFMRRLGRAFTDRWRGRALNIHPSLLPDFPGLDVHARVLAAGVGESGCTVHFVTADVDAGPIIACEIVPVLPSDTAESLAARVLVAEHVLYPRALGLVASGAVRQ